MQLQELHKRINYSRLWVHPQNGSERLYIKHGRGTAKMRVNCWFEIVNDRITPLVKVDCENQHPNWEDNKADEYKQELYKQYHEIIYDCELKRQETPLHERLKDDIAPVHENSLMHQAQALRFCCSMKVSALFADTGTGKTKVAIDLAVSRYEAGQINKVLIFCPVSTKKNFADEIDKWYSGSGIDWKIVGLETMSVSEMTVLHTLNWVDNDTMIIIDESHMCKTPFAKRSKRIKACCDKCSYKLLLTGTPAESVKDLYMQYAMLSDLIINEPNWLKFEEKYCILGGYAGDEIVGYKNVDYLMGLVEPYTYQISKEECLTLPAKTIKQEKCELTEKQADFYEIVKQELIDALERFEDEIVPSTLIFHYLLKLQQIACGFYTDENGEFYELGTRKLEALAKVDENEQLIIFCKFLYEIDLVVNCLGRDNCAVFTGENRTERDAEKDMFTRGERKYFVATMGSGGTGLNGLQHCNQMVFWSRSFKYIERKQCIGRIDRQGQTREMTIYDFLPACGIEYKISGNLERKRNLADEIKTLLNEKTKIKQYVEEL